jgi:AAA15 family ATPase/GTPase
LILKKLTIHNFKSLRNVCFEPGPLSVLVGANASGKTNFVRAVQFLSEVYGYGLAIPSPN